MTPTGASEASVGGGYGEMLVGSLLVLGLVCVAAWVVVRFGVRRRWGRVVRLGERALSSDRR